MHNFWFKTCIHILFGMLFVALLSKSGFSQGYTSPISWHHNVYEARVAALGQSTASLNNGTSYHSNPAIPLESGVLRVSSFLFNTTAFESFVVPDGADLYSPAISFSHGKISYSALIDYTSYSIHDDFGGGNFSNNLIRFQAGYQINDSFSLGAGFSHSSYSSPAYANSVGNGDSNNDATAWGITVGAHYQNHFESDRFMFSPQLGLTLNDLSNGFENENSEFNEHMPGQIRLGFGLDVSSKNIQLGRSLFGGGVYTGLNKYLARWETDEENSVVSSPSGFEALFTAWDSLERFDGQGTEEISLGEQISTSLGIELHFLETFYIRYGLIGGADLWIRPQNGYGVEVDLYYISLAVTQLNYHSTNGWLPQDSSTYVQATFRIPIDGKPRDTLLGRLLDR